jgi:hypothetical protein
MRVGGKPLRVVDEQNARFRQRRRSLLKDDDRPSAFGNSALRMPWPNQRSLPIFFALSRTSDRTVSPTRTASSVS